MCGVVGMVANGPVNQTLYDSLTALQHRGQDAAGIMTDDNGRMYLRKALGLVRDVFDTRHMLRLKGHMGIGHVRYPTQGSYSENEAQPLFVNSPYGIALVHNGNLTNADILKKQLFTEDLRHLNTDSDSEIILNIFAHELQKLKKLQPKSADFFQAVSGVYKRCRGAYAVVAMVAGYGLVAFRDPNGIRPLIIGQKAETREWMVASESVALTSLGFKIIRDIHAGEAIYISLDGKLEYHQIIEKPIHAPCLFEYVYFARPDSIIDKISVYKLRLNIGKRLGNKILTQWPNHQIDVVIPIPETSRSSALELASAMKVKFREGFVKNRYIGRTFIMPGQQFRKKSVRQKLNPMELEFRGKNILLVDDSIVRGTTSKEIIQMVREVGANKVFFASTSPPVKYPNIYGIDMPNKADLIANKGTVKDIADFIGADDLIYLDLEDLKAAAQEGNPDIHEFEASVFDGEYVTGDEAEYLKAVAGRHE
jgi:amidophosphoribosyltransferase